MVNINLFLYSQVPQSANVRTLLRGKYAAAKLYQANQLYVPTDLLDIGISPGDLVSHEAVDTRHPNFNLGLVLTKPLRKIEETYYHHKSDENEML